MKINYCWTYAKIFQILILFFIPCVLFSQPKRLINKRDTILYLPYQDGKTTFSYRGKMGIIDSNGKVIVPASFSRLNRLFEEEDGFAYRFYYEGKKEGILSADYNIIIPVGTYNKIDVSRGGFFRVRKNGKYSFVDEQGKRFEKWFDNAKPFSEGLAPVKINGRWGFINHKCELIIPNIYHNAGTFLTDQLAAVKKNHKWGFIDITGKTIIPLQYDRVSFFIKGTAAVCQNGLWGFIDRSNMLFIPCQYDDAEPFACGLALVKKEGIYGYINKQNELKIPFRYGKAFSFHEENDMAFVKLNGKWVDINKEGNVMVYSYKLGWQPKNPIERVTISCSFQIDSLTNQTVYSDVDAEPVNEGGIKSLTREFASKIITDHIRTDTGSFDPNIIVAFIVDKDGTIKGERIVNDKTGIIGRQMLDIIRSFKWEPAKCNGKPVAMILQKKMIVDAFEE